MNDELIQHINAHPDFQLLRRVPNQFAKRANSVTDCFKACIIDLETMGLDAKTHEIIELGLLSFAFSTSSGIVDVLNTYNELNDPGKPIPPEVTKVTGIRDDDVRGKAIDWAFVADELKTAHLIICHNAGFDRNFLELQTADVIKPLAKALPFACTLKDIDWKARGFESSKLDYLNWKLGFFYDGHRAINDCWATFNLLIQAEGTFDELKANVRKKETLLIAENAPFDKKDLLKARNYRWSDGAAELPKGWYCVIANDLLTEEKQWLDREIYGRTGVGEQLPQLDITARTRYSFRAQTMK